MISERMAPTLMMRRRKSSTFQPDLHARPSNVCHQQVWQQGKASLPSSLAAHHGWDMHGCRYRSIDDTSYRERLLAGSATLQALYRERLLAGSATLQALYAGNYVAQEA